MNLDDLTLDEVVSLLTNQVRFTQSELALMRTAFAVFHQMAVEDVRLAKIRQAGVFNPNHNEVERRLFLAAKADKHYARGNIRSASAILKKLKDLQREPNQTT